MRKNILIGKWLVVGVILLFVTTGFIPAIAQDIETPFPASKSNWLYVGGSGPENYTTIQDAVDNATNGDTIFVFDNSSPYYEHVIIDKSIKLFGENKETTKIDGNGNGTTVHLTFGPVTISGFTIQNGEVGIRIWSDYNIIVSNIIKNNSNGIVLDYNMWNHTECDNNNISFNTITNNGDAIYLYCSYRNKFVENYISDNECGIILLGPSYDLIKEKTLLPDEEYQNNIYKNTITNSTYGGIVIANYDDVNIFQNNITNNLFGVYFGIGYYASCINNNIYQNIISGNTHGIFIIADADKGGIELNNIFKNNIMNNNEGIYIGQANGGIAKRNNIYQNNFLGNNQTINFVNSLFNHWVGNYWGNARLRPYPITGKLRVWKFTIPWFNFDWRPALKPYNIGV
jgi:parallel beta-helix repeat protein